MFSYLQIELFEIPIFKKSLIDKIQNIVELSDKKVNESTNYYFQAEVLLLESIGLKDFEPSKEPVNIKGFKESFLNTGRLDAEYYQKKYEEIESIVKLNGFHTISDVFNLISNASPSKYSAEGIKVIKTKNIRIPSIEIDITMDLTNEEKILVKEKDLLFASMGVGSLGRLSYIDKEIGNYTTEASPPTNLPWEIGLRTISGKDFIVISKTYFTTILFYFLLKLKGCKDYRK